MRIRPRHAAALIGLSLLVTACGGDTVVVNRGLAVQTPGPDAVVTSHTTGPLQVSVRYPETLDRGLVRFELTVKESGEDVAGLTIVATSDMPTMRHPQQLEAASDRPGRYTLDVPLGMSGGWDITFSLSGDGYGDLDPITSTFTVAAPAE